MHSGIEGRLALFPDSVQIVAAAGGDRLAIGGNDLSALAGTFGTPLYVYDRATMDRAASAYRHALQAHYRGETAVTYAGKAFLCAAIAQWVEQTALSLDCSSLGDLRIAQAGNVDRRRIVIHGVNKSPALLAAAIQEAGTLVVDDLGELDRLAAMWPGGSGPDLWLRYRPGIGGATHPFTQTGSGVSKFGMDAPEIQQAADCCRELGLPLRGLHFHLGSQLRDTGAIGGALERTLGLASRLGMGRDWVLCPGGGLRAAYHEDELPHPDIEAFGRSVSGHVLEGCRQRGLSLPRLCLEPGRSLIARAGVAIYRVGSVKTARGRRWLLLDGGLADNPRPALYQARYTTLPVWEPGRPADGVAWLGGPYCESGDVLIEALPLPTIEPGELVAVPVSGAYQLSMASNYNSACRPAVLWLDGGHPQLIQRQEQLADLLRRDRKLAV